MRNRAADKRIQPSLSPGRHSSPLACPGGVLRDAHSNGGKQTRCGRSSDTGRALGPGDGDGESSRGGAACAGARREHVLPLQAALRKPPPSSQRDRAEKRSTHWLQDLDSDDGTRNAEVRASGDRLKSGGRGPSSRHCPIRAPTPGRKVKRPSHAPTPRQRAAGARTPW